MQAAAEVTVWPTEKIEYAPWNPNVLEGDELAALETDMKTGGLAAINPLICCRKRVFDPAAAEDILVVLDGNHRLKTALKLGWKEIRVTFDEAVTDEAAGRAVTYTKNRERGHLDPFKEAENFQWYVDQGWTHDRIAEKFHIDRTTVTKRLSTLKVDPEVKKQVMTNSRLASVSNLEILAPLEPQLQKRVVQTISKDWRVKELAPDETVSTRYVEETAKGVKKQADKENAFRDAVTSSKFPKCPTCGKPPKMSYTELPRVECSSGDWKHEWNLKTGQSRQQMEAAERAKHRATGGKTEKTWPQQVKSMITAEEFMEAAMNFVKKTWPQFTEIDYVNVGGKIGKKDASMQVQLSHLAEYNNRTGARVDAQLPDEEWAVNVDANTGAVKTFRSYLKGGDVGYVTSDKQLKEMEAHHLEFLEKYGSGKPPAAPAPDAVKKKRGRPRKK